MSNNNSSEKDNIIDGIESIGDLDPEIAKESVPFGFLMPMVKAIDNRVSYNFNTLIQISLLLEYLYEALETKGMSIELDENFQKFQKKRIEEMQKEFLEKQSSEMSENDLDLKDD